MQAIRRHGFWGLVATAALALIMVGTDAAPSQPEVTSGEAPVVATRPAQVAPPTSLPMEDGVAVLPAWDGTPRRFVFAEAEEPMRLIEGVETIERPGAVQRIIIPRLHLDAEVVQSGVEQVDGALRYATPNFVVGQYGGINPGEGSNVVLAGHVGTRDGSGGSVFRDLRLLERGDAVEVHTKDGAVQYVVDEIRHVGSEALGVMQPTSREQVTLITCRRCNVDCERLVVVAIPAPEAEGVEAPVA